MVQIENAKRGYHICLGDDILNLGFQIKKSKLEPSPQK